VSRGVSAAETPSGGGHSAGRPPRCGTADRLAGFRARPGQIPKTV